jgi:hypothetical protein
MADESEGSALTILWGVTVVVMAVIMIFMAIAMSEEPTAALFGLGGLFAGALLATTYQMSRNQKRRPSPPEAVNALMDRMQILEQEQHRMAELEERVDFAERLLARAQDAALLPDMRRSDGRGS